MGAMWAAWASSMQRRRRVVNQMKDFMVSWRQRGNGDEDRLKSTTVCVFELDPKRHTSRLCNTSHSTQKKLGAREPLIAVIAEAKAPVCPYKSSGLGMDINWNLSQILNGREIETRGGPAEEESERKINRHGC